MQDPQQEQQEHQSADTEELEIIKCHLAAARRITHGLLLESEKHLAKTIHLESQLEQLSEAYAELEARYKALLAAD